MRRVIRWIAIGLPIALIAVVGGAAGCFPAVRHAASGLWNLPDRMPALANNSSVHYEPGAEDYARDVAALLPEAIARVEVAHGRPFEHPVTVGVYATPDAYMAANGLGSNVPVGVTFFGRVNLSPRLYRPQHQRLRGILTHELSHAHIHGWIGGTRNIYLPNWFKEGLAVMVSGGGGAELVSEEEARAAVRRGEQITIEDAGSLRHVAELRFDKAPEKTHPSWYPIVLAYREAGMFVTFLRASDGAGFDRMMSAILEGRSFVEAVSAGYHDHARSLWQKFVESAAD
jgi:hypothetical protein